MKAIKYFKVAILSLSIFALFSSCDPEEFFIKTIEFTADVTDPMLVLNSIIYPDSTVKISLSKSRFVLDDQYYNIQFVNDATLNLYEDGIFVEELDFIVDGLYTSTSLSKIGSTYKIEAIHPNFETISAETTIPTPVEIISIDTVTFYDSWGGQTMQFTLKFKDPKGIKNYYKISGRSTVTETWDGIPTTYTDYFWISSDDPVLNPDSGNDIFGFGNSSIEYFTDELISGKEYELKFYAYLYWMSNLEIEYEGYSFKANVDIILHSLTEENYLYHRSKELQYRLEDNPFAEAVSIYNNIENGIGIFAGESYSMKRFKFGD